MLGMSRRVAWMAALTWPSMVIAHQADYSRTPVLMVHGWFIIKGAGTASWTALKNRLVEAGWPEEYIYTPDFEDVQGCDPEHAEEIKSFVQELKFRTGAEKVDIVAHSEGALNTIYYLKKLCGVGDVRKVVTIAGAFHGTAVACLYPFTCGTQEMCIPFSTEGWKDNPVLSDLMSCDETPGDVLYASIWSPWDEIIQPPQNAILHGSEVLEITTAPIEHGSILLADETVQYVIHALLEGGANEDGPGWDCIPECAKGTDTFLPEPSADAAEYTDVKGTWDAGAVAESSNVTSDPVYVSGRGERATDQSESSGPWQEPDVWEAGGTRTDRGPPPEISAGCMATSWGGAPCGTAIPLSLALLSLWMAKDNARRSRRDGLFGIQRTDAVDSSQCSWNLR